MSSTRKKEAETPELKSGWVVKEGKIRHSWRRRFFVLQGGTLLGRIDYFKAERREWKGAISLRRADPAETFDAKQQQLFCIAVRTPTRAWVFGVPSETERTQWIISINAVIARLRNPDISTTQSAPATSSPLLSLPPHPDTAPPSPPPYAATDPEGDRARLTELTQRMVGWADRERALQRISRELVPRGRLIMEPSAQDGSDVLADDFDGDDSSATTVTTVAVEPQVEELSSVYAEWGEALATYACELAAKHQVDVLGAKGLPAVQYDDTGVLRDARYVLLAFSEAWEKTVGGADRQRRPRRELIQHCRKLLAAWGACLNALAATAPAEAFATASHARLGSDSPARLLAGFPELVRRIALWAVPSVTPLQREVLALQASEKSFVLRHLGRLLYRGPVRFGFLSVCQPATDGDNFARIAGRCPPIGQQQLQTEIPEGRLFCELLHDSLCFTSAACVEVAVPLLWIRKLEIETTAGCFMKFTRYLSQPSPEAQLESRVLYADNAHETFAWLSDITRAFVARRKHEASTVPPAAATTVVSSSR